MTTRYLVKDDAIRTRTAAGQIVRPSTRAGVRGVYGHVERHLKDEEWEVQRSSFYGPEGRFTRLLQWLAFNGSRVGLHSI